MMRFIAVSLSVGALAAGLLAPRRAEAIAAPASSSSGSAPRAAAPHAELSDVDLAFLVQSARRAASAAWNDSATPAARYRPSSLRAATGRVHVSLRRFGVVIGQGESGDVNLVEGATAAAEAAVRSVSTALVKRDISPLRLGLEVELIGPDEFVAPGLDEKLHFQPELYACFEPGADGVGAELNGRKGRARPSVIIAAAYLPTLALQHAESDAGFTVETKRQFARSIRYFRFRTVHLWQPDAMAVPVRLHRGVVPIAAKDVTADSLDRAIGEAAAHVLARQRRDAWFRFDYLPSADKYGDANSLFGQFEAAWALGNYGQAVQSKRCVDVAARVIAAAQSFVQPITANAPALAVIGTKEAAPLATTGLYLACRTRFDSPEIKVPAAQVADAIRLIQHEDGRFEPTFPPDPPKEQDAAAAGTAMLGLLQFVESRPNAAVDQTLRQAVRFYRQYFNHLPDRAAAARLAPALAAAYRRRPDPPVSDFLLAVGDWLVKHQIQPDWGVAAELVGGIVDDKNAAPDAETARGLVALCDALWMARRLGDRPRSEALENAVRLAARFVMQLQFHRAECYYVTSPDAVIGAARASLWNNELAVNDTAMALWGLARAREELFGPLPIHTDDATGAPSSTPAGQP